MRNWLAITALFVFNLLHASENEDRLEYIQKWKFVAIAQMHEHNIPASITMAQAILESGDGKSMLAREAKNHFGIKCHGWDGPGVYKDDDKKNECFRKYKSAEDSFEDHSDFLKKKRYAFLFEYKITDYKSWARGLKKAGYATDPQYPKRLINIIERYNLDEMDKVEDVLVQKPARRKGKRGKKESRPRYDNSSPVTERTHPKPIDLTEARQILVHPNSIKFVKARAGDTAEDIAIDLDMAPWQIKRYNDTKGSDKFAEGETVYIQPKRNQAKLDSHTSTAGQTLRSISQLHGVKLKRLVQYNGGSADQVLQVGTKVSMRKSKR